MTRTSSRQAKIIIIIINLNQSDPSPIQSKQQDTLNNILQLYLDYLAQTSSVITLNCLRWEKDTIYNSIEIFARRRLVVPNLKTV